MKTIPCWLAVLALGAGSSLYAQSSQQVTVNSVVQTVLALTVDINTVRLDFESGDYNVDGVAQKEALNATTFAVTANVDWRLVVKSESLLFSYSGTAGPTSLKSCSDLSLSPRDSTGYAPVSLVSRELALGGPGGANDTNHSVPVSYRLTSNLERDPPGTYQLTLVYTLMAR
jgi:hypothetical protein